MRIHISYQGLDKPEKKTLKSLIDERTSQLERKLGALAELDVSLKGSLQKHNKKKDLYRFGAHLHLPQRIVSADEEGQEPLALVRKVFDELERQAQRYKSRLRNEQEWKRKSRRKPLHFTAITDTATGAASGTKSAADTPAQYFQRISPWLDDLYDFARREITYLQAVDDLRPNDILPDELVDAVLVTSWDRRNEKPDDLDLRAWLHQLAIDLLDQEVVNSRRRRLAVSTDEIIEDEDIDTDLYEFYQPDEVLKVEDLIGVPENLPDIEAKQALMEQQRAQPSVAQLPARWRRAALLHHGAGFELPLVARILREKVETVVYQLQVTAHFLAERTRAPDLPDGVRAENVWRILPKPCPRDLREEQQSKFIEDAGRPARP